MLRAAPSLRSVEVQVPIHSLWDVKVVWGAAPGLVAGWFGVAWTRKALRTAPFARGRESSASPPRRRGAWRAGRRSLLGWAIARQRRTPIAAHTGHLFLVEGNGSATQSGRGGPPHPSEGERGGRRDVPVCRLSAGDLPGAGPAPAGQAPANGARKLWLDGRGYDGGGRRDRSLARPPKTS